MNIDNINKAIAVMRRARPENFRMHRWQTSNGQPYVTTIPELHACGNQACFAGYLAISEEWKQYGGTIGYDGYPSMPGQEIPPSVHIAEFLGISGQLARSIVIDTFYGYTLDKLVGRPWKSWEPQDIIKILEAILDGSIEGYRE